MGSGTITIEDVAKVAGVSRQTVSRVINQSKHVRPAVRERVEQAINELGYVPNVAARRMGGARSYVLLAAIEEGAAAAGAGERTGRLPIDAMLLAGIEVCSKAGYYLLFEQVEPKRGESLTKLSRAITALAPDGVILTPPLDDRSDLQEALAARSIAVETLSSAGSKSSGTAGHDDEGLGAAAANQLLGLGHKQIGFVSGFADPVRSRRRIAGYRRVMASAGSRAQRHFVTDQRLGFADALALAKSWLVPTIRPTAIIAETEEVALAILEVAHSLGIPVPKELSLLSLENRASLARSTPPISVIHTPYTQLFAAACERLIKAADQGATASARSPVPSEDEKFALIERKSLAKAPRMV